MTGPSFYALFVTNGAKASDDLAAEGLECWHFTFKVYRPGATWELRNVTGRTRHASRSATEKREPLFSGYVFASIPAGGFQKALASPYVVDVVRGGNGQPKPISTEFIDETIRRVYFDFEFDEAVAATRKDRTGAIVPINRARVRKKRKVIQTRMKKWVGEGEQPMARAA